MSTKPSLDDLSALEVAQMLKKHEILLVDVREPDEFAAERIPGALLYPLSTFDAAALPPDSPRRVVFQCGSGKRSAIAARARLDAGAKHVAHLAGGIGAWKAAGLPTLRLDPSTGKPA
ncbi:MAG TPA: rhodanese-like domain-containing protein [Steroidobacteraceae bacterium]|nr:rhodanese-like domain-containing protein [Steroidobacteraceae bacterium]